MSIGDALKFEKSWIGDIWKGIKKDPKRLVLGVDPLSTKGWNAILGRKDKSIVGDFGGPTKESYQNAQDKGIQTGTASTLHGAAKGVAAALGGYYAGGALGNIGSSTGSLDSVGSGAYANGALADAGYGGSSAGALAGTAGGEIAPVTVTATPTGSSTASSGFDWQKMLKQGMGQQQQQGQAKPNDWYAEYLRKQEEIRQQAAVRQQIAQLLAQQQGNQPGVTYAPV